MLNRLIVILTVVFLGLTTILLLAMGEELAEKLLPVLFVVIILFYIAASWYLGYFVASQKPSLDLILIGVITIFIALLSGFYIGRQ